MSGSVMTVTDNTKDTTKVFQSHLTNLQTQCNLIKHDICTTLNNNSIDDITPADIKKSKLQKPQLADYLLSLLNLLNTLCKCDHICNYINESDISVNNNQLCNNNQYHNRITSIESNCNTILGDIKTLLTQTPPPSPTNVDSDLLDIKLKKVLDDHQSQMDLITQKLDNFVDEKLLVNSNSNPNTSAPKNVLGPEVTHDECKLASNPTTHIGKYLPDYIDTELSNELLKFCDTQDNYHHLNSWSVLSFGEPYKYTGSPKDNTKFVPIPNVIKTVIEKITSDSEFSSSEINSCLINRYQGPYSHLSEHADDEPTIKPESTIFTISLGTTRDVKFRDCVSSAEECLSVSHGSLYTMSQQSQCFWKHRIDKCETIPADSVRYSLTLRCLRNSYAKSTIIVGDSNTQHLAFGSGFGTFGDKLPGRRVQAYTIEDINPEACIGYQNVLVHVGVNNLKNTKRPIISGDTGPVNVHDKFCEFRNKLDNIRSFCPKAKLIVSPILPTKLKWLNERALEFNHYLFLYLNTVNDIKCLDLNIFVDGENGLLSDFYGCVNNKNTDMIHLGREGIRKLAVLVRDEILVSHRDFRDYASVVRNHDVKVHTHGSVTS